MPLPVEAMVFFLVGLFLFGDLATTAVGLSRWFDAEEGNPIGAYVIHQHGVFPFFVFAFSIKVLLTVWAFHSWLYAVTWSHRLLADLLAAIGLALVVHNLNVLRKNFDP